MYDEFKLNKVFVTNIGEHPENGSLLLHLAVINDVEDIKRIMNEPDEQKKLLKLFLNTESKSLSFRGVELDTIVTLAEIPFHQIKVMTDMDTNIFVLFTDTIAFNFISLIDDSYDFLYQFFQENGFQMTNFDALDTPKEEVIVENIQEDYLN